MAGDLAPFVILYVIGFLAGWRILFFTFWHNDFYKDCGFWVIASCLSALVWPIWLLLSDWRDWRWRR